MTATSLPMPWNSAEATPGQIALMHELHEKRRRTEHATRLYDAALRSGAGTARTRESFDDWRFEQSANHPANAWR